MFAVSKLSGPGVIDRSHQVEAEGSGVSLSFSFLSSPLGSGLAADRSRVPDLRRKK
jgi:hypothetical protein